MRIVDYKNDMNAMIDDYREMIDKGWSINDKEKVSLLFLDIQAEASARASMILETEF